MLLRSVRAIFISSWSAFTREPQFSLVIFRSFSVQVAVSPCFLLIPNHSKTGRQNNVDAVVFVTTWHSTSALDKLIVACVLQIMSSTTLHTATMSLTLWRCSRFLTPVRFGIRSQFIWRVSTSESHFNQEISLSVGNQVTSTSFQHLPMLRGCCLHASSQHVHHETTIWSISAYVIQQSNNLSERSCCFRVSCMSHIPQR